ncbi:MAG: hypothetical protein EXS48_02210 [Candidatus Staskawiczbacteria bacterium]|nr:hypothetical protein [Candidatus Staskawiczbacteria bacterium]
MEKEKPEEKPSIFDKPFGASRQKFKKALRDVGDSSYTNRTSGQEREKMAELIKGDRIPGEKIGKKVEELKKELKKHNPDRDPGEEDEIKRQIKTLEKVLEEQ